jgi:hypothetical protein
MLGRQQADVLKSARVELDAQPLEYLEEEGQIPTFPCDSQIASGDGMVAHALERSGGDPPFVTAWL